MGKGNVSKFFKDAWGSVSAHSPQILTGIGIAGMVTMTVLAVRATPKALRLIEEKKKEEHVDKLPPVDVVKATWKCYIPAVATGVASTACLIGAQAENSRRNAALAAAYKLSETALTEYREKVIETIGEKKEESIREKVAKDKVQNHMANATEIYITERGDTLFLDPISGRLFKSDVETIRRAINKINYDLTHDILGYVSLNDFYDEIGLARTSLGDDLGWNIGGGDGLLEIDLFPEKTEDPNTGKAQPCFCLYYNKNPYYEYQYYNR